ncbi:unnamed protein product, partial [Gadus morhua 'NCC']
GQLPPRGQTPIASRRGPVLTPPLLPSPRPHPSAYPLANLPPLRRGPGGSGGRVGLLAAVGARCQTLCELGSEGDFLHPAVPET